MVGKESLLIKCQSLAFQMFSHPGYLCKSPFQSLELIVYCCCSKLLHRCQSHWRRRFVCLIVRIFCLKMKSRLKSPVQVRRSERKEKELLISVPFKRSLEWNTCCALKII